MLRMLPVVSFEMGIDCEYNELGTKDGTFVLHHFFSVFKKSSLGFFTLGGYVLMSVHLVILIYLHL